MTENETTKRLVDYTDAGDPVFVTTFESPLPGHELSMVTIEPRVDDLDEDPE